MKNQPIGTELCGFFLVITLAFHANTTSAADRAISYAGHSLEELRTRFSDTEKKYDETIDQNVRFNMINANVGQMIAIEKLGDRAALPFLEEKSLATNITSRVRERAAAAYVKIANLDENVAFMRKIFTINDNNGYWRSTIAPLFLQKVETVIASRSISDETLSRVLSILVAYAQSPANAQEADYVDTFLVRHCGGYTNSIQRLSMAQSFSDGGNGLEKKHFLPIKESVEVLPKKQRIDLRKRFPDLPPLPEDKTAGLPLKAALAIGSAFLSICVAVWIMARRRKTPTHEKE